MHTLLLVTVPLLLTAPPTGELGGWELQREYRFIWTKNQKKVGETTLSWVKVPRQGAESIVEVRSTRSYDDQGFSHRSRATTRLGTDSAIERFEETVEFSAQDRGKAQQKTVIEIAGGKARVQFRHNDKPAELEVEVDAQTHLTASQAVEHWVLLAARLPRSFEKREEKLFYPDFRKIIAVSIEQTGTETIRIASGEVKTTRHRFAAPQDNLQGTFWRDKLGRLVQIEFPNKLNPQLSLRVVLAEEKPLPPAK